MERTATSALSLFMKKLTEARSQLFPTDADANVCDCQLDFVLWTLSNKSVKYLEKTQVKVSLTGLVKHLLKQVVQ